MKKKFVCRLSAMLIAVLCVCLLCVPAFASSETVILPETTFFFDSEDGFDVLNYELPLVVGEQYIVVWNGVSCACVCEEQVSEDGDIVIGFYNLEINPFIIVIESGFTVFFPLSESLINPDDGTFTVSIIHEVLSPSDKTFSSITTYVDALRIQLSATSVIEVLAYIAGAAVLGVFLWWCVRKAVKGIKSAYLRGKFRL